VQIELFEEFVVLAEELNFHAAAKRLNITQSTLSKHVAQLETAYGTAFFERDRSGVKLTSAGCLLLECATAIRDEYALSRQVVRRNNERRSEIFVCGELDNPVRYELVNQVFGAFRNLHPTCMPHLLPGDNLSLEAALRQIGCSEADCAIFPLDKRAFDAGGNAEQFDYRLVSHQQLDAVMSPLNPLAGRTSLKLSELSGSTFIHMVGPRYSEPWKLIERQLRRSRIAYQTNPVAVSGSHDVMFVDLEGGILLLPRYSDDPGRFTRTGAVNVPINKNDIALDLYAVYRRNERPAVVDDFVNCLANAFAERPATAID
jgi:DNA-binding transcriptional LysR family regulator